MATDIRDRIIMGRYVGAAIKCLSTEVIGYQRKTDGLHTVFKMLWQTCDDDKVFLFRVDDSPDLLVEQPRIDVPQPEHLRKVVTDWQVTA